MVGKGCWQPDWPEEQCFRGTGVDRMTRAYEMMERYEAEIDAAIEARELQKLEVTHATTNLRSVPCRNAVREERPTCE